MVGSNELLTRELTAEKANVASLKTLGLILSTEVGKLSQSNRMMKEYLDILKKRIGVIHREAGDLRLSTRSLEASVGFGSQ